MNTNILGHYEDHYGKYEQDPMGPIETKYKTLKLLYHNKDNKATFTELKMNHLEKAILSLEKLALIKENIEYETIIEGSQRQRIKSYQLTSKGEDFFREVDQHMKDHGYSTFESEVETYMKISLIKPELITLRNKLMQIETERKKVE